MIFLDGNGDRLAPGDRVRISGVRETLATASALEGVTATVVEYPDPVHMHGDTPHDTGVLVVRTDEPYFHAAEEWEGPFGNILEGEGVELFYPDSDEVRLLHADHDEALDVLWPSQPWQMRTSVNLFVNDNPRRVGRTSHVYAHNAGDAHVCSEVRLKWELAQAGIPWRP